MNKHTEAIARIQTSTADLIESVIENAELCARGMGGYEDHKAIIEVCNRLDRLVRSAGLLVIKWTEDDNATHRVYACAAQLDQLLKEQSDE